MKTKNFSLSIGPLFFRPLFFPTLVVLFLELLLFLLGTWQLERKKWKENLLYQEQLLWEKDPLCWEESFSLFRKNREIENFPIRRFILKGYFLKAFYLMIPSLLPQFSKENQVLQSNIRSFLQDKKFSFYGYRLFQPFCIEGADIIWVDRGWVPSFEYVKEIFEEQKTSIEIRLEPSPSFSFLQKTIVPENKPLQNQWVYFSPKEASQFYKLNNPYFFYAVEISTSFSDHQTIRDFFPLPEIEKRSMRNEHLTYAVIWYSLCGFLGFLYFIFHKQQGRLVWRKLF